MFVQMQERQLNHQSAITLQFTRLGNKKVNQKRR